MLPAPGTSRITRPFSTDAETKGLATAKTNWAVLINKPPYHAYRDETTWVTFTSGGLHTSNQSEVEDLYGCLGSPASMRPAKWLADRLSKLSGRHRPDAGRAGPYGRSHLGIFPARHQWLLGMHGRSAILDV